MVVKPFFNKPKRQLQVYIFKIYLIYKVVWIKDRLHKVQIQPMFPF